MAKKKAQAAVADTPAVDTPADAPAHADTATAVADAPMPVVVDPVSDSRLADAVERAIEMEIPVSRISPSPFQTRKRFDQVKIDQLAASLKKTGQIQNIVVRRLASDPRQNDPDGWFEVICGERRLRAAVMAELPTLRSLVIVADDDAARELVVIENLERENVSAIEEAAGFEQLLDSGRYNQTTLAARLGCHPSHVSNRLRLLKLPEDWQEMIMDGLLPPTHARSLLPWIDRPAILESVAAELKEKVQAGATPGDITVFQFERMLLEYAYDTSRSMQVGFWDGPKFELTPERCAQLDISPVPKKYGEGTEDRAFAAELWDQWQEEAIAARKAERESSQDDDGEDGQDDGGGGSEPARDYSKSELVDWDLHQRVQSHVASVLAGRLKQDAIGVRVAILYMTFDGDAFVDWLGGQQTPPMDVDTPEKVWTATKALTPKNTLGLMIDYVQEKLAGVGRPLMSLTEMLAICADMDLDPLAKWVPDEELLDRCSDSQLRELLTDDMAPEKQVKKWGRARLIREALDNWPPGYLPLLLKPKALLTPEAQDEAPDADDDDAEDSDDDE